MAWGMKMKKTFREEVAGSFIKALDESPLEWHKAWQSSNTGRAVNAINGKTYKGINAFWLKMREDEQNFADNRWATFKQVQEKGWKVKRGSRGSKVEFYMIMDSLKKKAMPWSEYSKLTEEQKSEEIIKDGKKTYRYRLTSKIYTVFNGSQIEGIPELKIHRRYNDITPDEVVKKVSEGMGVTFNEVENGTSAFYSPVGDYVSIPSASQFDSDYDYSATALHELGHATGHKSRLNRDQSGNFGTSSYAYEEFVAEIASTFMGEYIKVPITEDHINRHKAYIQSWSKSIKDNKNYLFKAISDAEKAADFMIEKGELERVIDKEIEKKESILDNDTKESYIQLLTERTEDKVHSEEFTAGDDIEFEM